MLSNLIIRWKSHRELAEIRSHPVLGPISEFARRTFANPEDYLSAVPDANKTAATINVINGIREALAEPDPILAVRKRLATVVDDGVRYGVLVTTPEHSTFDGISGELKPRITDLAKIDERLQTYFRALERPPVTEEEMLAALYNIVHYRRFEMQAYDMVRRILGDHDPDKQFDWFRPFLISQSIFVEYLYRLELGMSSNIIGDHHDGTMRPGFARHQVFGSWPEILWSSEKSPRLVWENRWRSTFGEPSAFAGLAP
jgi:hypothetical protein